MRVLKSKNLAFFIIFLSFFCVNLCADESGESAENSVIVTNKTAENAKNSAIFAKQSTANPEFSADFINQTNQTPKNSANSANHPLANTDFTISSANTKSIAANQPHANADFTANPTNETAANPDDSDDFADDFEAEFAQDAVFDPLSGYNRFMTGVNLRLYRYVLRPIARGYDFVVPDTAQSFISNFFSYLATPLRLAGNLLQLKFAAVGDELKRFGYNTLFGFFGLIDAASKAGVPLHHADFGLVLAHWGVGGGFHLVLPVLGPSNLRDTLSIPFNWYAQPTSYLEGPSLQIVRIRDFKLTIGAVSTGIKAFGLLNEASLNTQALDTIYNTPNPYPLLRDNYERIRNEQAK